MQEIQHAIHHKDFILIAFKRKIVIVYNNHREDHAVQLQDWEQDGRYWVTISSYLLTPL